jgi:para-nitrobenzyl esterase
MAAGRKSTKVAVTGRRQFLLSASMAGAALMPDQAGANQGAPRNLPGGRTAYIIDDTSAVGETESGKVVGYIHNDIRIFKGIPYAEILSPEGRWVRGARTRSWAGKRSSRAPGFVCPPASFVNNDALLDEVLFRASGACVTYPGEDCLRINIWTPGLDNRKRQVLFWVHGGGYNNGSSLMSAHYDFTNLAQYGDAVVVSVNHRLNALGFLDLTAYGSRWAESANLGMLDIIDALKWVRGNISNFGGDPAKVMIFGHSGGGSKVSTLLAMPDAKGLFNRAVIQSPGPLPLATQEEAAARTATFLKLVDISSSNLDALYKLPVDTLTAAAAAIANTANVARDNFATATTSANNAWRPVVDGRTVLYEPTRPNAPSDVPLMIGTALHESFGALGHPEYDEMNEPQARELVRSFFGPVGDQVYDVYKAAFPNASPFDLSATARATGRMRAYSLKIAQNRAALNSAPSYLYWFQWRAKILGGRPKSHHELEIPLVFLNSDETPHFTGGTAEPRELGAKMADAWLAFARSGNPNHKALPHWAPVTPKAATAMVFDVQCRIDSGSDTAAIDLFWKSRHSSI